jgi:hypothetical protein
MYPGEGEAAQYRVLLNCLLLAAFRSFIHIVLEIGDSLTKARWDSHKDICLGSDILGFYSRRTYLLAIIIVALITMTKLMNINSDDIKITTGH